MTKGEGGKFKIEALSLEISSTLRSDYIEASYNRGPITLAQPIAQPWGEGILVGLAMLLMPSSKHWERKWSIAVLHLMC